MSIFVSVIVGIILISFVATLTYFAYIMVFKPIMERQRMINEHNRKKLEKRLEKEIKEDLFK
jgi:hypothetical protein